MQRSPAFLLARKRYGALGDLVASTAARRYLLRSTALSRQPTYRSSVSRPLLFAAGGKLILRVVGLAALASAS